MKGNNIFKHCPECNANSIVLNNQKAFTCTDCGWIYFHNTAAASGCFIRYKNKLVMIRRNREPCKGLIDVPGGFVDFGESLEESVKREIKEEINVELDSIEYFCSFPNTYNYRGITYYTCDIYFLSDVGYIPNEKEDEEVEEIVLVDPLQIDSGEMAFPSCRKAMDVFKKGLAI